MFKWIVLIVIVAFVVYLFTDLEDTETTSTEPQTTEIASQPAEPEKAPAPAAPAQPEEPAVKTHTFIIKRDDTTPVCNTVEAVKNIKRQCKWEIEGGVVALLRSNITNRLSGISVKPASVIVASCSVCWYILTFPAEKLGITFYTK